MKALLLLAIVIAVVLVVSVIVLAWFAFVMGGMSYTLTQLLIVLKDQDEARRDADAKAIAIRTARHGRIADHLVEIVKALSVLRDIRARIEATSAVSDDDRKTAEMQPSAPATLGENAPEQPPTGRAHSGYRPALLPDLPTAPPNETQRDSDATAEAWIGPPSGSTRVGLGRVPAR